MSSVTKDDRPAESSISLVKNSYERYPLQSCSIYCKSSIYCIHAANILHECFTRAVDLQYHTANAVYTANMLPFILQKCCIDITHWAKYCISSIYCKYTANILQKHTQNSVSDSYCNHAFKLSYDATYWCISVFHSGYDVICN